jgi:acyl-coenzyme A thioesterase PaaI-like protein
MTTSSGESVEEIVVPWHVLSDYQCFGCSPRNDKGLRLRFERTSHGLACLLRFDRTLESYPGVVHGGIITTVCDEIMGNLLVLRTGMPVFTTTLRTRYISSLFIGAEYHCEASTDISPEHPGPYQARAEILDTEGNTLISAVGQYQPVDAKQSRSRIDLSDSEAALIEHALARLRSET